MSIPEISGGGQPICKGADFIAIGKGWSGDIKYHVTSKDGLDYLLRISPLDQYGTRKIEFETMEQIAALGIAMSRPISFGICDQGVYSLQGWIDGRDADEAIPHSPPSLQYAYGIKAGIILKTIHSIPAPADLKSWKVRFDSKIDRKLQLYSDCPIKFENDDVLLDYIHENRHLIDHRPQCCQHGDYHIGNMMIDQNGKLQIIDFDRLDHGDPWEEFNRIVWCARVSTLLATGMVDGYFDGNVPMDFWNLLALYIANNTLSSLPWAIPFGQDEIDIMTNITRQVLEWYDRMKNPVPTWYVKQAHLEYLHCERSSGGSSR